MNEQNNLGTTVNLLGLGQARFDMGLTGNADRMRENNRLFTIADKFSFLLRELNTQKPNGQRYCDGHIAVGPNYIYPIAGSIGLYETVHTFFQLSIFENLAANKPDAAPGSAPAMADELTFTTMIDLMATPKVTFSPVKTSFQITDASLTGTLKRMDTHKVTVGLALPSGTAAIASLRGYVFSGAGVSRTRVTVGRPGRSQTLVLNRITATATSPAEQLALTMIDQLKSRELRLISPSSP